MSKKWPTPNLFSSSSQSLAAAFQYLPITSVYMRNDFVILELQTQLICEIQNNYLPVGRVAQFQQATVTHSFWFHNPSYP